MPRGKSTITRDSVFRRTGESTTSPQQGLASKETARHQTAVWLTDADVQWLDTACYEVRKGGWRSVTRSALIRSLIRAAMENSVDLTGVSGEAELTHRLLPPTR